MPNESTVTQLKAERDKHLERARKLETAIEILVELGYGEDINHNGSSINPKTDSQSSLPLNSYDLKAPFRERVVNLIRIAGKFAHVKDLTQLGRDLGETETISTSKQTLQERISNTLTAIKGTSVEKFQNGTAPNAFVWGLKDWVEDGKPKDDFMWQ